VISLLEYYNNTYVYFPQDKDGIIFFHNDKGNAIRTGLTIFSLPRKSATKNNKSRFVHLSLQQNYFFKILKRGMPKLYEYNINQKYKKPRCTIFNEALMNCLKTLYDNTKIPRIHLKQIKIKSKITFQISYDKESNAWIVNDNLNNCVIFSDIAEIDKLYLDNKITKNMYQICKECDDLFRNILKKKESQNTNVNHNFLHEISQNTFLGYYLEDRDEIIFYSIVSNLQYNVEQFCLPINQIEDICFKFGLPYEKTIVLKTYLVTFEQIQQELKYIYRRISEDYASFQNYGAIVLIEHDSDIVTGFKILNQEMKVIKKMKYIKFNNNSRNLTNRNNTIKEEDEIESITMSNRNNRLALTLKSSKSRGDISLNGDKLNNLMNELSHYQLPRCVHIYCKLFNDITEEDTLYQMLEMLENISKNVNKLELCNCIKEKKELNFTSINLLSCLIPKDNLDNYNIELMNTNFTNNMLENGDNDSNALNVKNVKSKTMFDNKPNYFSLNNHPKVTNIFFDNKPNIYTKKKAKKKVKFVDEVYNKSLVEEIPIKSFKGYNVKNNFIYGENVNNYKSDKKTSCCSII
jgi:hypothetical protein